jgi:ferric-dicitrate binding protein FerR (iron transport regulator)
MGNLQDKLSRARQQLKKLRQRAIHKTISVIEMATIVAILVAIASLPSGDSHQQPTAIIKEVRSDGCGEVLAAAENELRHERLPDGSTVETFPGTRMRFDFSDLERRIYLSRGEARFTVAKDPARPFIVETDVIDATAVGTIFTVRVARCGWLVKVDEGAVQISGRGAATGVVRTLRAGETLELAQKCPQPSDLPATQK